MTAKAAHKKLIKTDLPFNTGYEKKLPKVKPTLKLDAQKETDTELERYDNTPLDEML